MEPLLPGLFRLTVVILGDEKVHRGGRRIGECGVNRSEAPRRTGPEIGAAHWAKIRALQREKGHVGPRVGLSRFYARAHLRRVRDDTTALARAEGRPCSLGRVHKPLDELLTRETGGVVLES